MSHMIQYNSELGIIETTVQGEFRLSDVREIVQQMAQLIKTNGCLLLLSDFREATSRLSTREIYDVPGIFLSTYAKSGVDARSTKRAVVVGKDVTDFVFYETVVINSGQNARVFREMDKAVDWLQGKLESIPPDS